MQRTLLGSVTDAIITTDPDFNIFTWNHGAEQRYGWTAQEAVGRSILKLLPIDYQGIPEETVLAQFRNEGRWRGEVIQTTKHGQRRVILNTTELLRDQQGAVIGALAINRDIPLRKRTETALQNSETRLRLALDGAQLGVWERNLLLDTSDARCRDLFGLPAEGPVPNLWERIHPDDVERVKAAVQRARDPGEPDDGYVAEYRLARPHPDGTERWLAVQGLARFQGERPDRVPVSLPGVVADVTEQRTLSAKLEQLAYFDPLTGLANRTLLRDRVSQAIAHAQRTRNPFAVLFLDLDNFKILNDSLGHFGDQVLKVVAQQLSDTVRAEDTVARLGGDEFVIVLNELTDPEDAAHVGRKVLASVAEPFTINGQEVRLETSIGVALYQGDESPDDLLKHADLAMYRAKGQGKGQLQLFTPELNVQAHKRLTLARELRLALERGEFTLYFQPGADLVSERLTGLEALVRWNHPERGLLLPRSFIPLAEETGLIHKLGTFVLEQVCQQLVRWQGMSLAVPSVAANLSVKQLQREGLVVTVRHLLRDCGLEPPQLELEITESTMMQLANGSLSTLETLKHLGVTLLVDDFGTGYSSLAYLRRLPVDGLKIDRSFLSAPGGTVDPQDAAIVRTIITLGQNLNLKLIGEGVETSAQRRFLLEVGCPEGQGFFSQPLPAAEVERLSGSLGAARGS